VNSANFKTFCDNCRNDDCGRCRGGACVCICNELTRAKKILAKANLWEHHRDCKPLSVEGCRCGLWDAMEYRRDVLGEK
jgi:hypothetical protein